MSEQAETTSVHDRKVACEGGSDALGHPLVYLTMQKNGTVECPYCGRRFVLTATNTKS